MTDEPSDVLAQMFEQQRDRLVSVSYRILGSRADAEDTVQEAWLRLHRQDASTLDNLAGWLTTVVYRLSLDALRSRQVRKEAPYEQGPSPLVLVDDEADPSDLGALTDAVGLALLVVLERLTPEERLAFVLHDTFSVPFAEIADILGKSVDATKMLASRARRKVTMTGATRGTRAEQRKVVDAFLAAARNGDFAGLLEVLDPQVRLVADMADGRVVVLGATAVATRAQTFAQLAGKRLAVLVDGKPGLLSWRPDGSVLSVLTFTVVDGVITSISSIADPQRLADLDLPGVH